MLSARFYVLSSIFFTTGALLAFYYSPSLINALAVAGSVSFLIAALLGLARK